MFFFHFNFNQQRNRFITKYKGSNLKKSTIGFGNFIANYLALESPFFDQISIFIHGPRYFFLQNNLLSKIKVDLGPFHKVVSLQNKS